MEVCLVEGTSAIYLVPYKKSKARKTCKELEPRLEGSQGCIVPSEVQVMNTASHVACGMCFYGAVWQWPTSLFSTWAPAPGHLHPPPQPGGDLYADYLLCDPERTYLPLVASISISSRAKG